MKSPSYSLKAPELLANCAEALKIQKRIAELQNKAQKMKVTEKFEKAYPEFAIALQRYSKSRIFAAKEYKGPRIRHPLMTTDDLDAKKNFSNFSSGTPRVLE